MRDWEIIADTPKPDGVGAASQPWIPREQGQKPFALSSFVVRAIYRKGFALCFSI
jgi:hypothetical protein